MSDKVTRFRKLWTTYIVSNTTLVTALKFLDPESDIPWQRVISSSGKISSRGPGTNGAQRQREALEEEGVEVLVTRETEFSVHFGAYGWFPDTIAMVENDGEDE